MRCPVCKSQLSAKLTKPGSAGKIGVYFTCPEDSRHVRGFVNDPTFVQQAQSIEDPTEMLV